MASLRPSNHRNNNRNPNSATGGGASVAQANSSLAFGSKRNTSRTLHRQASNSSNTSEKNYQTEKNSGHNSEGRNSNQNSSVANTMHSNSRLENSNSASVSNSTSEKNLSPANKPEDNKQNHSGKTIKSVAYPFMQVSESINGILLPKFFWPTVRRNGSSVREKLLKLEAEGREFAKYLRSLEPFIQKVKGENNFW